MTLDRNHLFRFWLRGTQQQGNGSEDFVSHPVRVRRKRRRGKVAPVPLTPGLEAL